MKIGQWYDACPKAYNTFSKNKILNYSKLLTVPEYFIVVDCWRMLTMCNNYNNQLKLSYVSQMS